MYAHAQFAPLLFRAYAQNRMTLRRQEPAAMPHLPALAWPADQSKCLTISPNPAAPCAPSTSRSPRRLQWRKYLAGAPTASAAAMMRAPTTVIEIFTACGGAPLGQRGRRDRRTLPDQPDHGGACALAARAPAARALPALYTKALCQGRPSRVIGGLMCALHAPAAHPEALRRYEEQERRALLGPQVNGED